MLVLLLAFLWCHLGLQVDEFLIQLIGLRYTEPDMTVSYPGFLSLLLKLNTMIRKQEVWGGDVVYESCEYGPALLSIICNSWRHSNVYIV